MASKTIKIELRTENSKDFEDFFYVYDTIYRSSGKRWFFGTVVSADPYYNCGICDDKVTWKPGFSVIVVKVSGEDGEKMNEHIADKVGRMIRRMK